ncbi:DUF294 nucleotidyltransferase-like domain-containing protein [Azospirillum sp.]|uniref:DUF294 nucleotidyltransferase-like domain-containing protein n=1 Tax=Azospirillum sp. TaxID=34012 RepID=UPI002D56DD81|nr:DUF294 nucleotidyltransferase-like domain-containing protein [Azospirillum sp.]HYD69175.1 DUF294 nucleotidyltransferase-like domain-containing protein [Azospirillum sp.]
MDANALTRLDSFPYQHRLAEVMTRPALSAPGTLTLGEAARRMDAQGVSSLLVEGEEPGRAAGIVTERDVLRAVARHGGEALALPLTAVMGTPVYVLPETAYVYLALGRMDRLGVRHLAVTGADGRVVGIVTARQLLRQRAGKALALGDQLAVALDAAGMGAVRSALPALARSLLAERVPPPDVAGVLAQVLRDLTARAAELAAAEVESTMGPAPAPWCVLVLGSAGRGETLLSGDQDNALIHAAGPADDPWFAALGRRMNALLDGAGVPLCRGGVMAGNTGWRHDEAGWRATVEHWVKAAAPQDLLAVDIFFDFHAAGGDAGLAAGLRSFALTRAAASVGFLKNLAAQLDDAREPLDLLGRFRTVEGRVDLKLNGAWPVVAAARVLALRNGIAATGTAERLEALAATGALNEGDAAGLAELHAECLGLMLDQQLADLEAGRAPSSRVDVRRLSRLRSRRLRDGLKRIRLVPDMVREGLAAASAA